MLMCYSERIEESRNIQISTIYCKLEYGKYMMQYIQSSSFVCKANSGRHILVY